MTLCRNINGSKLRFTGRWIVEDASLASITNFDVNGIRRRPWGTTDVFFQARFGNAEREGKNDKVLPCGFTLIQRIHLKSSGIAGANRIEILLCLLQRQAADARQNPHLSLIAGKKVNAKVERHKKK